MTTYRLTKAIDWSQLHGQSVRIEVSESYVIAAKRDGSFVILAQAVRHKNGKHPATPDVTGIVEEDTADMGEPVIPKLIN